MTASRWRVLLVVALAVAPACAVNEADPDIRDEVLRSIDLVEPEITSFDEMFGEPDYQASTLEACIDGDLYDTRSYPTTELADLDELRQQLEQEGWDMFDGIDESASSSRSIRGSTERDGESIDVRVTTINTSARQAITLDLLFRSLALEYC